MAYLHGSKPMIIHRDLKPANVMLRIKEDTSIECKIIDFGLATIKESSRLKSNVTAVKEDTGTCVYMAPELLEANASRNHKIDVYAYAILVFELYTRTAAWGNDEFKTKLDLFAAVKKGKRPLLPAEMDDMARKLVQVKGNRKKGRAGRKSN